MKRFLVCMVLAPSILVIGFAGMMSHNAWLICGAVSGALALNAAFPLHKLFPSE